MNLFKTNIDHTKCLKRPDHWIGSALVLGIIAGLHYVTKNNIDVEEKLAKLSSKLKE